MILLSSRKLEHKLAANSIGSWEKAKYIIFVFVIYSIKGPIYVLTPSLGPEASAGTMLASFISFFLVILATYLGIKKCYVTNKETDNVDFIGRFVVLFIPMTLKFIAVLLPAFFFSVIIVSTLRGKQTEKNVFVYLLYVMSPIGTYVFYYFLNRSFERLRALINKQKDNFLTTAPT